PPRPEKARLVKSPSLKFLRRRDEEALTFKSGGLGSLANAMCDFYFRPGGAVVHSQGRKPLERKRLQTNHRDSSGEPRRGDTTAVLLSPRRDSAQTRAGPLVGGFQGFTPLAIHGSPSGAQEVAHRVSQAPTSLRSTLTSTGFESIRSYRRDVP